MKNALAEMLITVLPVLAMLAMGVLLCILLYRYFVQKPPERNERPLAPTTGRLIAYLAAMVLLSRLMIYLIALAGSAFRGEAMSFLTDPGRYWVRWDANHYVGLAENWYVNEGDPRFHIVFYPLFPLVTRILGALLGGHMAVSACLVSNLCLFGSCWALYQLVRQDQDEAAARRAVRYLVLCPASLFLSIPYSESLFLLLTLLCALLARRGRLGWAVLLGALSASTRVLGLLSAVPIFYEFYRRARERSGGDWKRLLRGAALGALKTLPVALGFAAYLLLNYRVTGDPLRFLTYQSEHWGQRFGSLSNTLKYTLDYAFTYDDIGSRLGTWIPQAIAVPACIALLAGAVKRVHPADGAYALLYIYMAISPTWLLSGPRYLMAMYALYPLLALVTRKKWQDIALTCTFSLGAAYFTFFYAVYGSLF